MEAKLRSYRESSLSELMHIFGAWIPFSRLQAKGEKANSRQRDYSLAVTFWAFLWQVLTPCTPCLEVVRKVQSFCSELKLKIPGSSNVAYCKARRRLASEGMIAREGSIVDASFVDAPRARNTHEQNAQIKSGERPEGFEADTAKGRQKDCDAPWTKKTPKRITVTRTTSRWMRRASWS